MKYYLGVANTFHDASLAIVDAEGRVIFAEANERYLQYKRAVNTSPEPYRRIEQLLQEYTEPGSEISVAYTWSDAYRDSIKDLMEGQGYKDFSAYIANTPPQQIPDWVLDRYHCSEFFIRSALATGQLAGLNLQFGLSQLAPDQRRPIGFVRQFDHHLTHAATACYTSPYREAACAILDGYGEGLAYNGYLYQNNRISPLNGSDQCYSAESGSLGAFYMYLCKLCGFGLFQGEEWKVMGLAAYGKFDPALYELMKSLIWVDGLSIVQADMPTSIAVYDELARHGHKEGESYLTVADLAYTGQKLFSEIVFQYLTHLHESTGQDTVLLGGGCMLNSSTNGQIVENTPFKNAYVFSAPADDGNSIGAALLAFYEDHPDKRHQPAFQSPYLGSKISGHQLDALKQYGPKHKLVQGKENISRLAAQYLADGKIIGWVQGRAEFGPRALGNRSILADPRSEAVKDRINADVKFREAFRPFAPAILHEHGADYFENYQETPYMERTLRFKPQVLDKIPGVAHVDGTGRLQSVKPAWNKAFYALIEAFYQLTGVPVVLNTSFNVMGKPIIHTVEDALAVFYTSGLDVLIIDDLIIDKQAGQFNKTQIE